MPTGYCTHDDVRRALREAELPGDASQDPEILTDAIASQTEWLEKTYKRHWYVPNGITEDDEDLIPTDVESRDDEHDIPTHGASVHGASERKRHRNRENSDALLEAGPRYERRRRDNDVPKQKIRIAIGDDDALEPPVDDTIPAYTRIVMDRRDVKALNELFVINDAGGYDDWVDSNDYDGGVGKQYRGDDYWVHIDNGGWSELYLDVHAMDDDLTSLSNAVYLEADYGHEGIPRTVRRAVAFRAGADLAEEAAIQIPENANVYNVETKADEMRSKATELLEVYE